MLCIVENERLTFEIDSEMAILDCTLECNTLAFQINTRVVADSDKLPRFKIGSFSVAGVCPLRENLKFAVVSCSANH